jgi:catechol 2,3-dioxygenase-like lactoylglutathione lyase family enzyme
MEPRISIITLGVEDLERSLVFYRDGLGFPTTRKAEDGIVFFQTSGTCLVCANLKGTHPAEL